MLRPLLRLLLCLALLRLWPEPGEASGRPRYGQLLGQEILLRSELLRPDPANPAEVWRADRPEDPAFRPREILSPGWARNGFATYFLLLHVPANEAFGFYLGENPANTVKSTFYRLLPDANGVPDLLEPVQLPLREAGQAADRWVVLVWDIAIPANAPVDRIKLEPQFWLKGIWHTYPMEPRITPLQLPALRPAPKAALPAATQRADATERAVWVEAMCAKPRPGVGRPSLSLRLLQERNARQYAEWFRGLGEAQRNRLLSFPDLCVYLEKETPAASPEWPLRLRDILLRRAGEVLPPNP